jgi:hypothetical protein
MPPEQEEECARVLKAIMEHDCAGPFLEPVDPHALEIPDYHVLVPRPMDLGTVKRQLAKHHYSTVQEFAGAPARELNARSTRLTCCRAAQTTYA